MATRDELRAKVFSAESMRRKALKINFFGVEIELLQPTTGDLMRYGEESTTNLTLVNFLIDYAYIPGTEEKVFEEGDAETLRQLPYNEDIKAVTNVLTEFTNMLIGDAEKN